MKCGVQITKLYLTGSDGIRYQIDAPRSLKKFSFFFDKRIFVDDTSRPVQIVVPAGVARPERGVSAV